MHSLSAGLGAAACYAEKWCDYEREVAVMVVRGQRERRRRGYFACTCAYFDAEDHT